MSRESMVIVGVGPRGLYAFENLILELSKSTSNQDYHFTLFERSGNFGCGTVYNQEQMEDNWINIAERLLDIPNRPKIFLNQTVIPEFPSYKDWDNINYNNLSDTDLDAFPPRKKIGRFLKERFNSLAQPLIQHNQLKLEAAEVTAVKLLDDNTFSIVSSNGNTIKSNQVLLTIGHQDTEPDKQLKGWQQNSKENESILHDYPYPIKNIVKDVSSINSPKIGIRGFGLAMIDLMRALANALGKLNLTYEDDRTYAYTADKSFELIPFSLDGLPLVPKPLNKKVDDHFRPSDEVKEFFSHKISNSITQAKAEDPSFLVKAVAEITADVIITKTSHFPELSKIARESLTSEVINWLKDDGYKSENFLEKSDTIASIKSYICMALGKVESSLDFCIGQVWRHLQPTIYKGLSYNACSDEVFGEIIKLDERMKRYAYGPPVDSMQQLVALYKSGNLILKYVNDPKIKQTKNSWELTKDNLTVSIDIMVNSVLDAPEIKVVDSPLVNQLLRDDLLNIVHSDFGIETTENGYVKPADTSDTINLALLGRLAKGTVIGVDAILECFGIRPEQWAVAASEIMLTAED